LLKKTNCKILSRRLMI